MGDCYIVRRGGSGATAQVPTLNDAYPQDVTVVAAAGASASFAVQISQPGTPAEYTYQWYQDGSAISGANGASVTISGLTAAASHSVYCVVTNKAGDVTSRIATLTVQDWRPAYTYTGTASLIDDGDYNWRIKFLTSGILTFSSPGNASSIDAFLVGGGGGTRPYSGGGGGGRTLTQDEVSIETGVAYPITVGAGGAAIEDSYGGKPGGTGGTTEAFGFSAGGGSGGVQNSNTSDGVGGDGGSGGGGYNGGQGGQDGADGTSGYISASKRTIAGGSGLDETTREFWETDGQLYASGGDGRGADTFVQQDAEANTGNGAPGDICSGGSGIVVIRNHR